MNFKNKDLSENESDNINKLTTGAEVSQIHDVRSSTSLILLLWMFFLYCSFVCLLYLTFNQWVYNLHLNKK